MSRITPMKPQSLFTLCLLAACSLSAADIYISVDGRDGASGQRSDPLKTLKRAASKAQPGDNIYFLAGRYERPFEVQGLKGSADQPITISAAPGETVVFDGTDALPDAWQLVTPDSEAGALIQPAQWQRMQGKLYSLKLDAPIYALVYDERLMTDARWPNARWDDPWRLDRYTVLRRATEESTAGRLHDGFPTENALEESTKWLHYDRQPLIDAFETLGESGLDFSDNVVLMSYAWGSFASRVTEHEAGSDFINYDTSFEGSGSIQKEADQYMNERIGWDSPRRFQKSGHGGVHFFLTGPAALDIEEEWWYHKPTQTLYFLTPDGAQPDASKLRGKRRDFQISAQKCEFVNLKGFEFFGGAALLSNCMNSRLEDCNFRFSAYNKFSVGDFDQPVTTTIRNFRKGADTPNYGNALVNCQFTYLDGNAFMGRSQGLVIDNVLIHQTQQTTLGLDSRSMSINWPSVIRRVLISDVGASVGIKGGGIDSLYELNRISRFGGLQYDGAALQMGGREQFLYRNNWSHDHPKRSYRFDIGSFADYSNAFGEMSYNIAWNTPGGFAVKGDDHLIHNNVLLGNSAFELFNMKRWVSRNQRTLVANNLVQHLSAGTNDWGDEGPGTPSSPDVIAAEQPVFDDGTARRGKLKKSPVLSVLKNNYMDDPTQVLRDPANLDFRLKSGSELIDTGYALSSADVPWKQTPITGSDQWIGGKPDIGAYETGVDHYWIPGFKYPQASTPVPPNRTTTAKPDCSLMWLGGYQADRHHLYVGGSEADITTAGQESPSYRGAYEGERNVCELSKAIPAGTTVYWRVDAERDGQVIKGPVWHFTVGLE